MQIVRQGKPETPPQKNNMIALGGKASFRIVPKCGSASIATRLNTVSASSVPMRTTVIGMSSINSSDVDVQPLQQAPNAMPPPKKRPARKSKVMIPLPSLSSALLRSEHDRGEQVTTQRALNVLVAHITPQQQGSCASSNGVTIFQEYKGIRRSYCHPMYATAKVSSVNQQQPSCNSITQEPNNEGGESCSNPFVYSQFVQKSSMNSMLVSPFHKVCPNCNLICLQRLRVCAKCKTRLPTKLEMRKRTRIRPREQVQIGAAKKKRHESIECLDQNVGDQASSLLQMSSPLISSATSSAASSQEIVASQDSDNSSADNVQGSSPVAPQMVFFSPDDDLDDEEYYDDKQQLSALFEDSMFNIN